MKKILTILLLASLTFVNTSCDDYLDVNKNVDAPDYIDATLYLPGVLSAWQGCYWDIRAIGPLTQMFGTNGYTSFANNYYSAGSDAAGEMWRVTYFLQGYNLENMINQAMEDEAWTLVGIGYAIKSYSWDYLTKMHGEAPLTDAFVPGLLAHSYDQQSAIYTQIRQWAADAISYLEREDTFAYGTALRNGDLVYAGDKTKWIKFAHGVIVRNLSSLSNKTNFVADYAQELLDHAALALQSTDDDANMRRDGGGADAQFTAYNNAWGVYRGFLDGYWAHDFAVQTLTGTLPEYDQTTGDKMDAEPKPGEDDVDENFPFKLASKQIITDTSKEVGHFDPRMVARIGTLDDRYYKNIDNEDSIKARIYYGSTFTSYSGPIGTAANLWGTRTGAYNSSGTYDGQGRWLYRNDAPYILMTAAEIQFCVAETYWKMNNKSAALAAWKKGVALDLEFVGKYLVPGSYKANGVDEGGNDIPVLGGGLPGGDKITTALYKKLAAEYLAGPYVEGMTLSDFTLSHIMMQKYVALYPWGAPEAWVDLRKYHYDIDHTGDYPSFGNGWNETAVTQKWDTDETKVYKGFYLAPAQVENRRSKYNIDNEGSPCFRIRPRYNSEYMWNIPSLETLKPVSGMALNYHCSIPWFAYPGEYPAN